MAYGTNPRGDRRDEDAAEDGLGNPDEYDPASVLDDDLTVDSDEADLLYDDDEE